MYGFILENYDLRIMWGYRVVTKKLVEATGRKPYWKMPLKFVVMPFYSKRSKIKNKIRACKMDSGDFAFTGKMKQAS